MFSHPRYVLKGGEVVIEDGDIRATPEGREFIVKPSFDPEIESFLKPKFEDVYTMSFENYPVEMERLEHADIRECINGQAPSPPRTAEKEPDRADEGVEF